MKTATSHHRRSQAVRWSARDSHRQRGHHRTDLRSYAGEQGSPFRGPAPEVRDGYHGAASSTGYHGAASSTGYQGAAMASGYVGRVMGTDGNALFLAERDDEYKIVAVWAGIVGRDGIQANVWYALHDGKPVEVTP